MDYVLADAVFEQELCSYVYESRVGHFLEQG